VIDTYKERFSGEHLKATNRKIEHWETTKDQCRRGMEADKRTIEDLSAPYGYDDLSALLNAQLSEPIRLDALALAAPAGDLVERANPADIVLAQKLRAGSFIARRRARTLEEPRSEGMSHSPTRRPG